MDCCVVIIIVGNHANSFSAEPMSTGKVDRLPAFPVRFGQNIGVNEMELIVMSQNHEILFVKMPKVVLYNRDLSPQAKLLYMIYIDKQGQNTTTWVCQETLANLSGMSKRNLQRYVAELESAGLIVSRRRFNQSNQTSCQSLESVYGELCFEPNPEPETIEALFGANGGHVAVGCDVHTPGEEDTLANTQTEFVIELTEPTIAPVQEPVQLVQPMQAVATSTPVEIECPSDAQKSPRKASAQQTVGAVAILSTKPSEEPVKPSEPVGFKMPTKKPEPKKPVVDDFDYESAEQERKRLDSLRKLQQEREQMMQQLKEMGCI